jgi:hypothetical protein
MSRPYRIVRELEAHLDRGELAAGLAEIPVDPERALETIAAIFARYGRT